jgi:hypothetical protein
VASQLRAVALGTIFHAYLRELVRRLRVDNGDALSASTGDGDARITWHEQDVDTPRTVLAKEADLATAVANIGEQCHDALWPPRRTKLDSTSFLVHLHEVSATRNTSRPVRSDNACLVWPDRQRNK